MKYMAIFTTAFGIWGFGILTGMDIERWRAKKQRKDLESK